MSDFNRYLRECELAQPMPRLLSAVTSDLPRSTNRGGETARVASENP